MRAKENLKNILVNANRYEDVMAILYGMMDLTGSEVPVRAYAGKRDKIAYNVPVQKVKEEAQALIYLLDGNMVYDIGLDDVENLWRYVNSVTDILLHNYAVSVSHQSQPEDMDGIRGWLVLDNLISCLDHNESWSVPNGWIGLRH